MKTLKTLLITTALFAQSALAAVNINTANAEALAKELNGIGIKKAEAIVNYRKQNGNFKTVEALTKVKGIGLKTVEKNRKEILLK